MKKSALLKVVLLLLFLCISFDSTSQDIEYESYTPAYHFYPSGNPTGLFYYNGLYYNNWGIASSKDLVHWKRTELGLRRDKYQQAIREGSLSEGELESMR